MGVIDGGKADDSSPRAPKPQRGSRDPGNATVRARAACAKNGQTRAMTALHEVAVVLALASVPLHARAEDDAGASVQWELGVVSDYLFRGVSQTDGRPTVQGGVSLATAQGWYAGGWASGVDFGAGGPRLEVDWVVGHERDLGASATLDVSLNRYTFAGARALDYNEWQASLTVFDDHRLTLGYSNDVWNTGTAGWYFAVESQWALARDVRLAAGIGRNVFRDSVATEARSYTDWNIRVVRQSGAAEIALGYYGTDAAGRANFGGLADSRVLLTVTIAR